MTDGERLAKNRQISLSKKETLERHSKMSCKSFTIKVQKNKLNLKQKEALQRIFLEQKWYKNYILNWNQLDPENNRISKFDTKLCDITHKDKDMNDVPVKIQYLGTSQRDALKTRILSNIKALSSLKKKGYQKPGRIKFSKEETEIGLKQYGITHKIISSKRVKVQGIPGKLPVNGLGQILSLSEVEIANARLLQKVGDYFVQFVVFVPKVVKEKKDEIIGIDFGCSTSFTFSNGEKIDVKVQESEGLKKLQKNLSRKQKSSKNFYKTRLKIQRKYRKQNNIKEDIANKLVAELSQYRTVVIQDEQLSNWQKTGHGRSVQHSVLGRVKTKLRKPDNLYMLSKWDPTTQLCPVCGALTKHTPDKRTFKCSMCGYEADRDINAAKNMALFYKQDLEKSTSGTEEINACGDGSTAFRTEKQLLSEKQEAPGSLGQE